MVNNTIWQLEDATLKTTMQFFADELLPFFHIEGDVVGFAPTELVQLEIQKLFQDFNLIMADGSWKHFEFQSKDEKIDGLKRFRSYEALASYQYKVDICTYVLYSGNIESPVTEFTSGFNTYRVQPIIMKGTPVEEVFENINRKLENHQPLTKKDLVPLTLCALMGGSMSQKERIKKAFDITRLASLQSNLEVAKIEAVMYAMAEKFLDSVSLEEVKEAVGMTRLGQMLVNDGKEKAKLEIAQELLDVLEDEVIAEKTGLPLETVQELRKNTVNV